MGLLTRLSSGDTVASAMARYRDSTSTVLLGRGIEGTPDRIRALRNALALYGEKLRPADTQSRGVLGRPQWPKYDPSLAIANGMYGWVYVCAMKNAKTVASLNWTVDLRQTDGRWVEVDESHPLRRLVNRPNEWTTWRSFITRMCLHLDMTGNSLVSKNRDGTGLPGELFHVRPHQIAPVAQLGSGVVKYIVKSADGVDMSLDFEESIHCMEVNPDDPWWGMGLYQAGLRAIMAETRAADWQRYQVENMMIPPGMFLINGYVNDDQWDDILDEIDDNLDGPANARKPLVMGGGDYEITYKALSMTPAELDFTDSRKLTREEVLAIWGTPPPVVGLLERATYSNIETARKIWHEDTIMPRAGLIEDALNLMLTPEFGDNLRIRADESAVDALLEGFMKRLDAAERMWKAGVPWNQAQARMGLNQPIESDVGERSFIDSTRVLAEDEIVSAAFDGGV